MVIALALVFFVGGLYIIIKGGDFLVEAALALNKISGINQVLIGATFVSVATTLPEVFVSIFAVIGESPGIAVGNAVGSMICNVALVLALYITFLPHRVSRRAIYGKSITLFAVTAVVFLFAANLRISWLEGIALLAIFSVFLLFNIREAKAQEKGPKRLTANNEWTEHTEKGLSQKADTDTNNGQHAAVNLQLLPGVNTPTVKSVIKGFAAGQIMLVIGAFMLVSHGERLAGMLGISETVVGLTAIAVGTSAPELITCIASIRKKSGGLALGNVIGSNIINCTLLLGTCGLIGDLRGRALPLSQDTLLISLPFLFVLYLIAILPMLFKARTYRWQGVALLMLYAVYVGYLVVVQPM